MSMITLTEKSITEIKRIINNDPDKHSDNTFLRVAIKGGGCAGMSWSLNLDDTYDEKKDTMEEQNGIKIVIDNKSALYVAGTTVDFYDDGLMRRGFVCTNPTVKSTCGCGSSVSF